VPAGTCPVARSISITIGNFATISEPAKISGPSATTPAARTATD
jgi:hypothetical protein